MFWNTSLEFNTRSVALLQENKNRDAIFQLTEGLRSMLNIVEKPQNPNGPNAVIPTKSRSTQANASLSTVSLPDLHNYDMFVSPDNTFTPFNRALVFAKEAGEENQSQLLATALMIYNLGLAHHSLGVQTGDLKELNKALRYYEMASAVLNEQQYEDIKFMDILFLSLCNNMGHINSHLFNAEETRECLELLPALLASYLPSESLMDDEDHSFFMMTVLFYHDQKMALAPAA